MALFGNLSKSQYYDTNTLSDVDIDRAMRILNEQSRYYIEKQMYRIQQQHAYPVYITGSQVVKIEDFSPKSKVSEKRIKLDNLIAYYYLRNR